MHLQVSAIHGAKHEIPAILAALVRNTSFCLRTIQHLIFDFSEVASIIFGCACSCRVHLLAQFPALPARPSSSML